jgi:hypothetical protein
VSGEIAVAARPEISRHEEPQEPNSLIRLALEKGVDVDVLERLVALQERVADRNAQSAFVAALSGFQEECGEVGKNKTASIKTKSGASFGYTYASLDAITRHIRPHLAKHGLSYSWDSTMDAGSVTVTCTVRHIDGHAQTASFTAPTESDGRMSGAQAHASVLTFGKRQSLIQCLGLAVTDEDTDGAGPRNSGPDPSAPISDKQLGVIRDLIEESGAEIVGFCDWLGVQALPEITQGQYPQAVTALKRKKEARRADS